MIVAKNVRNMIETLPFEIKNFVAEFTTESTTYLNFLFFSISNGKIKELKKINRQTYIMQ